MKTKNEVLKLVRIGEGVLVISQAGASLSVEGNVAEHMARYFASAEATEAFIVGAFFAPAGSSKKSKLRIVAAALDSQRW